MAVFFFTATSSAGLLFVPFCSCFAFNNFLTVLTSCSESAISILLWLIVEIKIHDSILF